MEFGPMNLLIKRGFIIIELMLGSSAYSNSNRLVQCCEPSLVKALRLFAMNLINEEQVIEFYESLPDKSITGLMLIPDTYETLCYTEEPNWMRRFELERTFILCCFSTGGKQILPHFARSSV